MVKINVCYSFLATYCYIQDSMTQVFSPSIFQWQCMGKESDSAMLGEKALVMTTTLKKKKCNKLVLTKGH